MRNPNPAYAKAIPPAAKEAEAPIYGDYREAKLQNADKNIEASTWDSNESAKMKED